VRTAGVIAAAVACALAPAGCGGSAEKPKLEPGTLRLGAVRGPTAWDAEVLTGLRAKVRSLNESGGIDQKVRLALAVGTARHVLASGARVAVLPCDARLQAESAAMLRRRGLFVLEPCNTELWRRYPDVWPVSVSPFDEARALVGYAQDQKYARIAVIGDGRMARAVRKAVRQADLKVARLQTADAVVVALAAPFAQAAAIRLRVSGTRIPILATHGMDDREALAANPSDLDGIVFTTFGLAEPGSEQDEMDERYRALTGHHPASSVAALGYDTANVLQNAIHYAASTRPALLAAAMPGLDVHGAVGRIAYPKAGGRDPAVNVAIVRVVRGQEDLVDRVGV
jgi:Periplasmic binding protein